MFMAAKRRHSISACRRTVQKYPCLQAEKCVNYSAYNRPVYETRKTRQTENGRVQPHIHDLQYAA